MFLIDQKLANEIERTQKLSYPITRKLFQAKTDKEVDEIEQRIINQTQEKGLTPRTAYSLLTILPLFLEHKAITNYINQTNKYDLRMMMPEILTIDEAIGLANQEKNYTLTEIEIKSLGFIFRLFLKTAKT